MKKLVIFDLDGTLLNTIDDLGLSTNYALQALGYPTHDLSAYPQMVGNGINKLIERALPEGEKTVLMAVASNKYQQATEKLIAHYFPSIPFAAVLGQRDGVAVKPDPAIVEDILQMTRLEHTDALYVGDSGVDMQTAANANGNLSTHFFQMFVNPFFLFGCAQSYQ